MLNCKIHQYGIWDILEP